jgi:hypothetical protein
LQVLERTYCAETIESATAALEGIDNIQGSDSLALGVFSVGDRVTDNLESKG